MSRSIPPKADELEISIIGPGRGECIIVHLGDGEWCVIDSCNARQSNEAVAVEYLQSFGNDALSKVRLIVATHWHDDHIRGLASTYRQAPNARFCCSTALSSKEFKTLLASAGVSLSGRSGVDEMLEISELIRQRRESAPELGPLQYAIENRALLHLPKPGRSFSSSVTALSPSDETVSIALAQVADLLPKVGEPQHRIVNHSPNHASVVLWIEAGCRRVLLGADLEHTNRNGQGWKAILSSRQDTVPASLFKVPHHGSENADCPDIWTEMLENDPVAVVTPFTAGVRLPKDADIERLAARTTNLYRTSVASVKPPVREASVERKMRQDAQERRILDGQPGHVRVRWSVQDPGSMPQIEVFNGALRVSAASALAP